MINSRKMAGVAFASAMVLGTSTMAPAAAAQAPSASTLVPVVLWAATGAVIGAVAWPYVAGGAAVAAAPGVAVAAGPGLTTWGGFLNTGAAAGAVLGGVGYLMTR